jgi:hypothetical protein
MLLHYVVVCLKNQPDHQTPTIQKQNKCYVTHNNSLRVTDLFDMWGLFTLRAIKLSENVAWE